MRAPAFPAPTAWRERVNEAHTYFYVSASNGARVWLIAGPYRSYEIADCARRGWVRDIACERDPRGVWLGWGVSSSPEPIDTPLGPLAAQEAEQRIEGAGA